MGADADPDPDPDVEAPPGYTVDRLDTDDAGTAAALWVELAAGQRDHGSHLLAPANRQRVRETMLRHAAAATAFVARDGTDVVGFVTFGTESEGYAQDVDRGVVHNLYVRPTDRGDGVGSALLAAAEAALADRGVGTVALRAMADNEAARRFYHRHGYEPHRVELEKSVESDTLTTDDR